MRRRPACTAFAIVAGLALPAVATAALVPLDQQRVVTALATASNPREFDSSSDHVIFEDPGDFHESLAFGAIVTGAEAAGSAALSSIINGPSFFAVASMSATAEIENDEFAEAFGRALVTYEFRLTAETPFTIGGQLQALGQGVTVFQLNGPSGSIFSFIPGDGELMPINEQGVLAPGDYDVFIQTSGFGQAHSVAQSSAAGNYYVAVALDASVSVPAVPARTELRIFPNPMRRSARIQLPAASEARELLVTVHAPDGRAVRTLRGRPGGMAVWDARNEQGLRVPAGVYFVSVGGAEPVTSRITLLR